MKCQLREKQWISLVYPRSRIHARSYRTIRVVGVTDAGGHHTSPRSVRSRAMFIKQGR
ncbi:hypothetical protein NJB14195_08700 [Mycobacterium montefiorense]|nr:hypothetical protein NJB14195_08700 [Mycobacterium montefiorense]